MSTPPDGLHPGVSLAEYTRWNARRSSVLRYGMRSAAHMLWAESRGEQDSTAATELGDVTHCAVLEPERLESRFVLPMEARTRTSNTRLRTVKLRLNCCMASGLDCATN